MEWYERMEVKSSQYNFVSTNVQEGERRKEEWMIESDATAQVFNLYQILNSFILCFFNGNCSFIILGLKLK